MSDSTQTSGGRALRSGAGTLAAWVACAGALAVIAFALFPALRGELVYDDLWVVARNPALAGGRELIDALASPYWSFAERSGAHPVGYWRPLTTLALFAGRIAGGGEPTGFHAVSLALHLASAGLVFHLARRLTRSTLAALAAALLFGLHPVQVESVAWIAAVGDPLAGALVLGSLAAYFAWRERGSEGSAALSGALLFAALLAKESSLAWFPLALALDAGRPLREGERRFGALSRALAPALAAVGVWWLARALVFGSPLAGFDRVTSHLFVPWTRWMALRIEVLGGALGLAAFPCEPVLFREVRPVIPWNDRGLWLAVAAIAAWCVALAIAWRARARAALCGLLWMASAVLPATLAIASTGRFPLSDRFLYLCVAGAALALSGFAVRVPWLRIVAPLALLALAGIHGWRAHARIAVWQDEEALFRAAAQETPRSMYVQWGLGRVLLAKYRSSGAPQDLAGAQRAFVAAQDLAAPPPEEPGAPPPPPDPSVLVTPDDELQASLGVGWCFVFCALDMPDDCATGEAVLVFRALADKAPQSTEAWCGLGVALRTDGKLAGAREALERALEIDPDHRESRFNLGQLARIEGKPSEALAHFERCTELDPLDSEGWLALGTAAIEAGDFANARRGLARAKALAPSSPDPLIQLGVLAGREGRFDKAREFLEDALRMDGARGEAHLLRAKALLQLGERATAIGAFRDACNWLPGNFEAHYNLAVLLLEAGEREAALPYLERAVAIEPNGEYSARLRQEIDAIRAESR